MNKNRLILLVLLIALVLVASSPTPYQCLTHDDCGDPGYYCAFTSGSSQCLARSTIADHGSALFLPLVEK